MNTRCSMRTFANFMTQAPAIRSATALFALVAALGASEARAAENKLSETPIEAIFGCNDGNGAALSSSRSGGGSPVESSKTARGAIDARGED